MNSWKLFLIWAGISVGIFKKHGEGSSTRRFAISSILRYRTQCLMTTVAFKTYSRSSVTTTSVPPSPSQMPTDFSASGSMPRSSSVTEVAWGSLCTSSPSSSFTGPLDSSYLLLSETLFLGSIASTLINSGCHQQKLKECKLSQQPVNGPWPSCDPELCPYIQMPIDFLLSLL